ATDTARAGSGPLFRPAPRPGAVARGAAGAGLETSQCAEYAQRGQLHRQAAQAVRTRARQTRAFRFAPGEWLPLRAGRRRTKVTVVTLMTQLLHSVTQA